MQRLATAMATEITVMAMAMEDSSGSVAVVTEAAAQLRWRLCEDTLAAAAVAVAVAAAEVLRRWLCTVMAVAAAACWQQLVGSGSTVAAVAVAAV